MTVNEPIAVIGLACRTPGAADVESFWRMVLEGRHAVMHMDRELLLASGEPAKKWDDPDFVPAYGHLDDALCFDAGFFGISAAEAALMDPQIRVGLECAWSAFDSAGYAPGPDLGRVGVYVSASMSTYLAEAMMRRHEHVARHGSLQLLIASDKDHLAGQIAYRLDLRGPAMAVGAACASSLVAVDVACRALAAGDVDMAVAGGVSIHFPQQRGYRYEPGGIYAPDGHCRAFAVDAAGVTPGAGAAMLLFKPLARAIEDGDVIHAVIRGSAVSGDGADRIGYTAPSEDGQVRAIALAWRRAGIPATDAGLLEGHGTGTPLGDAVEIAALQRALPGADCALGSVKSNVGHLDAAAGALSLIKVVKAVEVGCIPPSLHVTTPNPGLRGSQANFRIPAVAEPWPEHRPRVAGVSSFGIGGMNAHVVVTAFPPRVRTETADGAAVVLTLSACDKAALRRLARSLAGSLSFAPDLALSDLSWTLALRSVNHPVRAAARVYEIDEALRWFEAIADGQGLGPIDLGNDAAARVALAWWQGEDVPDLARVLCPGRHQRLSLPPYPFERREFRQAEPTEQGIPATPVHWAPPLVSTMTLGDHLLREFETRLSQGSPRMIDQLPRIAEALDRLTIRLVFDVLFDIGAFHSDGRLRNRVALMDGVDARMVPLLDFLLRVGAEERLVGLAPPSSIAELRQAVVAVDVGFAEYADFLVHCAAQMPRALANPGVTNDAIYGEVGATRFAALLRCTPQHSEVEAAFEAVAEALVRSARDRSIPLRVLEVGAGAGGLTAALVDALPEAGAELVVSDLSGLSVSLLEARWPGRLGVSFRRLDLMRDPVAQGLAEESFDVVVALDALHAVRDLEAGMASIRRLLRRGGSVIALENMRPSRWSSLVWGLSPAWWTARADWLGPLRTLEGWRRLTEARTAGMKPVLLRPIARARAAELGIVMLERHAEGDAGVGSPGDWLYTPAWVPVDAPVPVSHGSTTMLLLPSGRLGEALKVACERYAGGESAVRCFPGDRYERIDARTIRVRPASAEDLAQALADFSPLIQEPLRVLHAFALGVGTDCDATDRRALGFDSLLALSQAFARVRAKGSVHLGVLVDGVADLTGDERLDPLASLIDAPIQLMNLELPHVTTFRLDVDLRGTEEGLARVADGMLALLNAPPAHPLLSVRGQRFWRESFERRGRATPASPIDLVTAGSTILAIGGLGGMGRALAPLLATVPGVHVAMTSRHPPVTGNIDATRLCQLQSEGIVEANLSVALSEVLEAGATLSLHAADVAEEAAMTAVVLRLEREHGAVRAVLHAAGEPDCGGVMMRRESGATALALRAKLEGVHTLLRVLGDRPLDLLVFCASIGSLLPRLKFGEVAYVAGNTHLVATARQLAAQGRARKILALSWTDWHGGGMSTDAQERLRLRYRVDPDATDVLPDLLHAITPEQGRQAFLRALSLDATHVVVCAQPLQELMARHAEFTAEDHAVFLESHRVSRRASFAETNTGTLNGHYGGTRCSDADLTLEDRLARLWAELLGVPSVMPDDDFFDLGGDSLLGIRVLNRLREEFGVSDSLAGLMSATTVSRLADRVRHLQSTASATTLPSGRMSSPSDDSFEDIRL